MPCPLKSGHHLSSRGCSTYVLLAGEIFAMQECIVHEGIPAKPTILHASNRNIDISCKFCNLKATGGFRMLATIPCANKAGRMFLKTSAVWTVLAVAILPGSRLVAASPKADRAVEFSDLAGQKHKPLAVPDAKATLLFFLLPDCPNSNAYAPEIKRICVAYEARKVAAFIVHADPDVTVKVAKSHAKEYALPCPVLLDPSHRLVEFTGVTTAPEVAVVSPDGKILYRGRIDDLFADFGKRRPESTRRDLREALDAILAGKDVATKTTKAIGCPLPEPKK